MVVMQRSRPTTRASDARTATYRRGQEVFGPGRGGGLVYIVRAGCVRLYKPLPRPQRHRRRSGAAAGVRPRNAGHGGGGNGGSDRVAAL